MADPAATASTNRPAESAWRKTVEKALGYDRPGALPILFHAQVLILYAQRDGCKILRTDNVGRLIRPGQPVLDFGITENDAKIHIRYDDLQTLVPPRDHPHWLDHLATPSVSATLLKMHQTPNACQDDGPLREWAMKS